MALIIILIKAGLSLDLGDLRRVGRPAVLMSFLPASFEILAYILFAPMLLGITRLEAAVMGAVLGAVSPAVVVPRMVRLGNGLRPAAVERVQRHRPALGEIRQAVDRCRSAALRAGGRGSGYPLHPPGRSRRRGDDPAGPLCPGVLLALAGTRLDGKERLFCVIAYLPKATVQAAIGSVPLAMGLPCGALVLSVAVLAILITAPLGAIGIDSTCRRLLRPAD